MGSTLSIGRGMNGKEIAQALLDAVIRLAERMLRDHGDFHPYGGIVKATGEIVDVGAVFEGAQNDSKELIAVLVDEFQSMAANGVIVACAIVCNTSVKTANSEGWADAIKVNLDCKDGYSITVYKPYTLSAGKQVKYSGMLAQKGQKEIFPEY